MPLYMTQFAYTPEAWATLVDNPEDRSEERTRARADREHGWPTNRLVPELRRV
jgi:hypothetical protein